MQRQVLQTARAYVLWSSSSSSSSPVTHTSKISKLPQELIIVVISYINAAINIKWRALWAWCACTKMSSTSNTHIYIYMCYIFIHQHLQLSMHNMYASAPPASIFARQSPQPLAKPAFLVCHPILGESIYIYIYITKSRYMLQIRSECKKVACMTRPSCFFPTDRHYRSTRTKLVQMNASRSSAESPRHYRRRCRRRSSTMPSLGHPTGNQASASQNELPSLRKHLLQQMQARTGLTAN
jgi:hypothetical protein